ncbi:Cof-type HAD-IIB family hydrolase [Culicoidibacter larvae]|nr:Cof-type HAD-IIB family hydrolase [Culicoidibacter larvae]
MHAKYKIAFFDIDGTLVDSYASGDTMFEKIPQSAKDAIRKLEANGIITAIATGRGKAIIQELVDALGMHSYISSNGQSLVFHGEEIHKEFVAEEKITMILDALHERIESGEVIIGYETPSGRIIADRQLSDFDKRFDKYPQINGSLNDYKHHDVYQVAIYCQDRDSISIDVPGVSAKVVAPVVLNVIPEHVSKAYAIEKMLAELGIDKSEAIAFGDELNDLEMFGAVGLPIAMGNAVPELKAAAAYVTDDVDKDGIYNACVHFNLI